MYTVLTHRSPDMTPEALAQRLDDIAAGEPDPEARDALASAPRLVNERLVDHLRAAPRP